MNHYPQAPQSIGKVLDSGFSMYRAVLKPILPLSFAVGVVAQLPQLVPYMVGSSDPAAMMGVGVFAAFCVWFVVYIALYNGWLLSMDALARGGAALDFGSAIAAGAPKILRVIGAMILFMLAITIGTVLLVIPGLILMVSLFFFWYLVVLEDKGAIESLKASHQLVWGGNWWRTVAVITVGGVIYFVAILLTVGLVGVVIGISAMGGPTPEQAAQGLGAGPLVIFALQALLTALLLPMWNSLVLVLLRDLQLRKAAAPAGSS